MAAIRSKNTSPEVFLRKLLFKRGYRYSLHNKKIPGTPDLWMPKYNTCIFIHGCFWHRHKNCEGATTPKTRTEFWTDKFRKNMERDDLVRKSLHDNRIKCLIVWECTIKKMKKDADFKKLILDQIEAFLNDNNNILYFEL